MIYKSFLLQIKNLLNKHFPLNKKKEGNTNSLPHINICNQRISIPTYPVPCQTTILLYVQTRIKHPYLSNNLLFVYCMYLFHE